jgi:uncharacterized protein YjiS (DUF1127 family)
MSFLHRFIVSLQIWRKCSRDRRELAAMDDRSLRDIGLTRYDVEFELRKPFWRKPFISWSSCGSNPGSVRISVIKMSPHAPSRGSQRLTRLT